MQASADLGAAIARHFDLTFRLVRHERVVAHERYFKLITREMHPLGNLAIIRPQATVDEVREAVAELQSDQFPSGVVFHETVSPEIRDALKAEGFESHGAVPGMSVQLDNLRPTRIEDGYRFERVNFERCDEWTNAFSVGYELPLGLARLFSPSSVGPDEDLHWFAIYKGDRMQAVSMLVLKEDIAGIYCVATMPEARGKGLGAHVTAEPLRIAREMGYTTGILQSSEMGYSVYEKLGFVPTGDGLPMFVRMPG